MNKGGVVIGLDIGTRRIGVACGDFEVCIAAPLPALLNERTIFTDISWLIKKNRAEAVVVGLPRDADGKETTQSQVSRDFATKLASYTDANICFQDESLTSVLAEKNLRERRNFSEIMLRDGTLDSEAATIILQDFLNRNKREAQYGIA
jgi:putative Holliday junction resolvase